MPTPFIMDPVIERHLKDLAELAAEKDRIIPLDVLQQYAAGFDPDDPSTRLASPYPDDQTITLPLGWMVTLSYEFQPMGLVRHLSMSSPAAGRVPHPEAVRWVMDALGFMHPLEECLVYPETYDNGRVAMNVIEVVESVQPEGAA
jgi:hypothetical protein